MSDIKQRRAEQAWAALSKPSQEALLGDARALAEAAGDPPETDPGKLLFERSELLLLRVPESISVASRPGDTALLRVPVEGGASANVKMVREGSAWKVDLAGTLKPRGEQAVVVPTATTAGTSTSAEE